MSKEQNVINYYMLCNRLKDVIRTGWKTWNVQRERVESIAEHIYGVQMLAIAMKSEYEYDIDIMKVIYMLAIHELGETIIGDITQFQDEKDNKQSRERAAVHKILSSLIDGQMIEELWLEFDERQTKEAIFSYECDKLECDIQSKIYDQENCVDVTNQKDNPAMKNEKVRKSLEEGKSWSTMWLEYGQSTYPYDENFMAVSKFVTNNNIGQTFTKVLKNKCKED